MKIASLGSGSEGNALIVQVGATTLLIDCGFSAKETERRMALRGIHPSQLTAILVTHEHDDHIGGVFQLAKKFQRPVYLSYGTWRNGCKDAVQRHKISNAVELHMIDALVPVHIGECEVLPFPVPHDAAQPTQFVIRHTNHPATPQLGVLTDVGHSTPLIIDTLQQCQTLVLEFNHDREQLAQSKYPPSLRERVGGHYGHLNNQQSHDILTAIMTAQQQDTCSKPLETVVAAHLSQQNNCPQRVAALLQDAITQFNHAHHPAFTPLVACQHNGFAVNWG